MKIIKVTGVDDEIVEMMKGTQEMYEELINISRFDELVNYVIEIYGFSYEEVMNLKLCTFYKLYNYRIKEFLLTQKSPDLKSVRKLGCYKCLKL